MQTLKLPKDFLTRLPRFVDATCLENILAAFCAYRPSTFRVNTLKTTSEDLLSKLHSLNIEIEPVSFVKNAFILKHTPQKVLTSTDIYNQGLIYIQSLSSMLPPLVMDPKINDKVLDITAAPGSKTTQIASIMENKGEIIANDISKVRLYKLAANLKIQGVTNTKITRLPAESIWKIYPEYFDKTLVDVPCSMEGRFQNDTPKSFKDWSAGKVKILSQKQKFILRSAISATKPGGTICYSTCTLSPEENEEVIDWVLKKTGDALQLVPIDIAGLQSHPGLTSYNNRQFDPALKHALRIYPEPVMEGFFIAKIVKLKSTL